MNKSEFIQLFKNNAEPLVSIKTLLIERLNHTKKTLSKTVQTYTEFPYFTKDLTLLPVATCVFSSILTLIL